MIHKLKELLTKYKWLIIILLSAIIVRLIYLYELSLLPGFSVPMVDEKWHWLWAHEIIEKTFWGNEAYFRAPLYPYLLAFIAKITGSSIFWSKFLQILISGGTVFFIYRLAGLLFDQTSAIVAGLIYAFYGTLIFYESSFLMPVLFIFFLMWGIYRLAVFRNVTNIRIWLITGIIFGLSAITRPNVLLVIPFLMLWMFFQAVNKKNVWSRIKTPLALLLGTIIVITPVTIRNALVTGDFILISSQGGINFYLGNNPTADGLTMLMPEVDLDESVSWNQFRKVTRAAAERENGGMLSDAEQSSFWFSKANNFIINNPLQFLSLVWKKTVFLLTGFENSDNSDIYYQRTKSFLFSILLWDKLIYFPFGLLLPLTVVGIYVRRKDFHKLLPIYIFILAYIPSIVLFLVTARHRLPLVPFMIIISSGGIVALSKNFKIFNSKQIITTIVLFTISLLLINQTYYNEGKGSDFQIHFNNGIKYEHLSDYVNAEKEYQLADESYPYSAPLINNLAYMQFQLGKYESADSNYHRAINIKPDYAPSYNNLALLLEMKGNLDSAITLYSRAIKRYDSTSIRPDELSQIYLNMADIYEAMGNLDSASICYQNGLQYGKDYYKAYYKAAAFYARHGAYEIADTLYSNGQPLHDLSANDFFNWGLSFIERKQYSTGISLMLRALKRDESLYQAYYCIAVGYYENNYPADTINKYLDLCFQYNPDYKPALELKSLFLKKQ